MPFTPLGLPRPKFWPPRTLLRPLAPGSAFLLDEVSAPCGRAGHCPAKYRHPVRPARDPRGEGAQTCVPSRDPARSADCCGGGGRRVPGPEPAEGRSRCDSSAEGAGGTLGTEGGVRAPELTLRASAASGARAWGCALRPLLAALRARRRCGPSCRCHQPAEAELGAGPGLARPPQRRERQAPRTSWGPPPVSRKRLVNVHSSSAPSAPAGWAG